MLIGITGMLLGLGGGFTVLYFRDGLIRGFTRLTGSEDALARFYQFSQLPAHTSTSDVVMLATSGTSIQPVAMGRGPKG